MSRVVPPCLYSLINGASVAADPENVNTLDPPEWMDAALVEKGQQFALCNFSALSLADVLSLIIILTSDGRKALVYTNRSSTVFTAFKRYLSTANRYTKYIAIGIKKICFQSSFLVWMWPLWPIFQSCTQLANRTTAASICARQHEQNRRRQSQRAEHRGLYDALSNFTSTTFWLRLFWQTRSVFRRK